MRVLIRIRPKRAGHALIGAFGRPRSVVKMIDFSCGTYALMGGPLLNEAEAALLFGPAIGASGETLRHEPAAAASITPPPGLVPRLRSWTEAELTVLREQYPAHGMAHTAALLPDRTPKAIKLMLKRLGIGRVGRKPWTRRGEPMPKMQPGDAVSAPAEDRSPLGDRRSSSPRVAAPIAATAARPARPIGWVERHMAEVADARAYLGERGFSVQRADRDAPIAAWRVSGFTGTFSSQQLIDYAAQLRDQAQEKAA